MAIDQKLIRMIMALYKNPTFKVAQEGFESSYYRQDTGIRQGCPLSPYLFLLVMAALFNDVQEELDREGGCKKVQNTNFNEILYADDTLCVTQTPEEMQRLIRKIEQMGKIRTKTKQKQMCHN